MYKRALFVIAVVAACGDDGPARHLDGGTTSIDSPMAPMPDASFGPVAITIKLNGAAQPNIVVHFQNADSSLVATEMTDGTGTATHAMAPGGYVTAVDAYAAASGIRQVYTYQGVKPGDHLQLALKTPGNIRMNFTLPVQSGTEITKYVFNSTCSPAELTLNSTGSGFQPSGQVLFKASCATTDILVVAYNANNDAVGSFFVPDVAITANGQLNFQNKTYAPTTSRTYTYNTATGLTQIEIAEHLGTAKGTVGTIYHSTTGVPNTATLLLPTFTNAIGLTQATTTSISESQHEFLDWGPLSTSPLTTDVGARKLVDVSSPSYDNATHTLSWTEGTGVVPDADFTGIAINRTDASNNSFIVEWRMVAPHSGASSKYPTLPAGAMDYNADADDIVDPFVLALIKSPTAGYDALRANGFLLDDMVDLGNYFDLATTAGVTTGSAAIVIWVEPLSLQRRVSEERVDVLRHRTRR